MQPGRMDEKKNNLNCQGTQPVSDGSKAATWMHFFLKGTVVHITKTYETQINMLQTMATNLKIFGHREGFLKVRMEQNKET